MLNERKLKRINPMSDLLSMKKRENIIDEDAKFTTFQREIPDKKLCPHVYQVQITLTFGVRNLVPLKKLFVLIHGDFLYILYVIQEKNMKFLSRVCFFSSQVESEQRCISSKTVIFMNLCACFDIRHLPKNRSDFEELFVEDNTFMIFLSANMIITCNFLLEKI